MSSFVVTVTTALGAEVHEVEGEVPFQYVAESGVLFVSATTGNVAYSPTGWLKVTAVERGATERTAST